MGDLKNSKVIIAKGLLFLLAGSMSGILLWADLPTLRTAILLSLTVWCFCRFYYFAFYVIEHYVDSRYKFAGLLSFVRYLVGRPESNTVRPDSKRD